MASFYDEGTDDEPLSDNAGHASRPAAVSNRDVQMASASTYKPAAKPKKWTPQSRYLCSMFDSISEQKLFQINVKTFVFTLHLFLEL